MRTKNQNTGAAHRITRQQQESSAGWWGLWMKQGWHRFHCTDGHTLVVDAHGVFVRSPDDLAAKARRRVRGIIAAMPDGLDWSA